MQRLLSIIILLISSLYSFAQRYDNTRLYDFGLPKGKELSNSIKFGVPVCLLGLIICYFTMWSKSAQEKNNTNVNDNHVGGCIGCVVVILGAALLLPLFAWVEAIGMSIIGVAIALILLLGVCYWIYDKLKGK